MSFAFNRITRKKENETNSERLGELQFHLGKSKLLKKTTKKRRGE